VLFAVRRDLRDRPGGDTVQIEGTAEALRKLGVEVVVSSDDRIDLAPFSCVHLWHLQRTHETYVHLVHARTHGKPAVLTPIYWPDRPSPVAPPGVSRARRWREETKNAIRLILARSSGERRAVWAALKSGWGRCRQELLELPAVILPNSRAEVELLAREAPIGTRFQVVPNAVEPALCRAALARRSRDTREGVLCVGHFDHRKNQLALIGALRDMEVQVTFVGEARRLHQRYYRRCRRLATPRMRFLGKQPHEAVLDLMGRSRVHVCPSRFETPGLVNLEAAAMGCTVVVPDCPPVREYFQDDAIYIKSDDPGSIRPAILRALAAAPSHQLAERVVTEYTWEAAARATLPAYHQAIRLHGNSAAD
jgi:glycosyltransferase involved in cell wall biosynthesis